VQSRISFCRVLKYSIQIVFPYAVLQIKYAVNTTLFHHYILLIKKVLPFMLSHTFYRWVWELGTNTHKPVLGNILYKRITLKMLVWKLMFCLVADTYEGTDLSMDISVMFQRLAERLREEEKLTEDLLVLQGALQLLLSGASVGDSDNVGSVTSATDIQPSQTAQSNFVVNIT